MLKSALILLIIAVICICMKIVIQKNFDYLIVDVLVKAIEYMLFLSIGYLFGWWLIEKAENYGWTPSYFTKETSASSNQEKEFLEYQQEDDLPESNAEEDVEEDESEDDRFT
jgi:hypothetical protein